MTDQLLQGHPKPSAHISVQQMVVVPPPTHRGAGPLPALASLMLLWGGGRGGNPATQLRRKLWRTTASGRDQEPLQLKGSRKDLLPPAPPPAT